jgi:hypothetical protein
LFGWSCWWLVLWLVVLVVSCSVGCFGGELFGWLVLVISRLVGLSIERLMSSFIGCLLVYWLC